MQTAITKSLSLLYSGAPFLHKIVEDHASISNSDTCHLLSNKASFCSFGKHKSKKLLCIDGILFCTNRSVFFCLSGSSLYILVLCGELLRPVMSHCCTCFFFFFICLLPYFSVYQLGCAFSLCKHRLGLCGHVPPVTLCSYSDTFCNHCVPNKTSLMSTDATVGANFRST